MTCTLQLPGKEGWSEDALVDSGSPACLFSRDWGEAIGVEFGASDATYDSFEILGERQPAQKQVVTIVLDKWPDIRWELDAWFFLERWDWKLQVGGILGTEGFLTHWIVTMLRPLNMFVVASPDTVWRLEPDVDGKPEVQVPNPGALSDIASIDPLDPEVVSPLLQFQEDWDVPTQHRRS